MAVAVVGRIVGACLMLVWPALAAAHQGTGPHGGTMADAGPYSVELIVKEKQLQVFVLDDKTGGPVTTTEASATATVLNGQDKEEVTLRPGPSGNDGNLMIGELAKGADPGMRVVVLIHIPGKPSVIARFAF